MAVIKPFKAVRPSKQNAHKVAALPYDAVNTQELKLEVGKNPLSFLRIDRPEINFDDDINPYDQVVYEKAQCILNQWIEDEILVKDEKDALYIYQLTMKGRTQRGLVVTTAVDDYDKGIIKRHELTRKEKEIDRIRHVKSCNAHTGPIFLTYKGRKSINIILEDWVQTNKPIFDFTSNDGIRHEGYKIEDTFIIDLLIGAFANIESLYIADGHHRAAAAATVSKECDNKYFLSVLFPDDSLKILDYNRVVKDLNGLNYKELLETIGQKFEIKKIGENIDENEVKVLHDFKMYVNKQWYELSLKKSILNCKMKSSEKNLKLLDVNILTDEILEPILDIKDLREDPRIEFIGGIKGYQALEYEANNYNGVAFMLKPTTVDEMIQIADQNLIMPPKSTWFEPKLRSGLFIHRL